MTTNTPVTEDELKASAVAPRVTKEALLENIVGEYYFTACSGVRGVFWEDVQISGKPAAEVGPAADQLRGMIHNNHSRTLDLLTFCVLVLKNGFTVTGESACADPKNYNADIGRRLARENAEKKIWPLMGYELRTRLQNQNS